MSIYRSYFSKNNCIIKNNYTNNSQNPVCEISYGTINSQVSRFIFDINLEPLKERIESGLINENTIVKHVLRLTNTIKYREDLLGTTFSDQVTQRASSFSLDLFNIDEEWDEGSGYEFLYNNILSTLNNQPSNWFNRKTNTEWLNEGYYNSGTTEIIGTQDFSKGNEDIYIDITDYINSRLFSGNTETFGLGLKFPDEFEVLSTPNRKAVAFHSKKTNTFYEPFVETIIEDTIQDDRNYFYLDKDNELYLYSTIGGKFEDVTVEEVNIINDKGEIYSTLTGNSIVKVNKGIYKINLNISSSDYPDGIIFYDEWILNYNNKTIKIEQEFYLIENQMYHNFDFKPINSNNIHIDYYGILFNEKIKAGDIKRVVLNIKQLYNNQNNNIPLDIEYRLFINQSDKFEVDIIPFTKVNRTKNGYEFFIDTSWLIPQDYNLVLRLNSGAISDTKSPIKFTVVSNL